VPALLRTIVHLRVPSANIKVTAYLYTAVPITTKLRVMDYRICTTNLYIRTRCYIYEPIEIYLTVSLVRAVRTTYRIYIYWRCTRWVQAQSIRRRPSTSGSGQNGARQHVYIRCCTARGGRFLFLPARRRESVIRNHKTLRHRFGFYYTFSFSQNIVIYVYVYLCVRVCECAGEGYIHVFARKYKRGKMYMCVCKKGPYKNNR
jgi:hypothetical protein